MTAAADTEVTTPGEATAVLSAFERVRREAVEMGVCQGWGSEEEMSEELPTLEPYKGRITRAVSIGVGGHENYKNIQEAFQARALLRQIAAWAEGGKRAFEQEAQMKATAEAKQAAGKKPPVGFGS